MEPPEEPTLKRQKLVIMDNPNEQPPTLEQPRTLPQVPPEERALGALKFRQLCKQDWYVDKTMLIKTLVEPQKSGTSDILEISAPPRFGKSINMDMLKSFIENREDLKVENRKLFEDKKIFKEVGFFEEHFGKYPVIHVNFISLFGENFEEYLGKFKRLIYNTFNEHGYLLKSEKLSDNDKDEFNRYYRSDKFENLDKADLVFGLQKLSKYLYKHFDKKVYVLIDELDAPVSTGLFQKNLSKEELTSVVHFIHQIITLLLKDNEFVGNSLLNTSHHIGAILSNNIIHRHFLSKPICRFYGFTDEEVNYLLRIYQVKEEDVNVVKEWYNGYSATDEAEKNVQIYSNRSILRYLNTGDIKSYWSSCCLNRFKEILLRDVIQTKIQKLMNEYVNIRYIEELGVGHITILKEMINCPSSIIEENDADLFMQFLFENGLFNAIPQPGEPFFPQRRLKIPNNEILQEFEDTLYSLDFFKRYFKFEEFSMDKYIKLLKSISENPSKESFVQLAQVVRDLYSNSPRLPKNEFEFHTHLFHLTKKDFSETFADVFARKKRKYGADIVVYIEELKTGIILEIKFGNKHDSKQGLIHLFRNQHYTVFGKHNFSVDKMVLIGLHMSEDNQITISYFVGDPKNFDERNIETVSTRE